MKTAGVVLDFYDDANYSINETLPEGTIVELCKQAHILTPEEREVLRDEAYALVMVNEGKVLRKFACVDEANTILSVLYFMQNYDKLPTEAIKTAAANLEGWCEEYGIEVPYTIKLAAKTGMSRTRDSARQPTVSEDSEWNQRTNILSVQGVQGSGRVAEAASSMKTAESKEVPHLKSDINLDSFHKLNPEAKPPKKGKKKQSSIVDVTGLEADAKTATVDERTPLSMHNLQRAIEYFSENYKDMEPIEAHIFAVKTASRAEELGVRVPDELARYGSITYADDVDAHMANRLATTAPEYRESYVALREKRASIHPEDFAEELSKIDHESGLRWVWGGEVADPYYATFGKTASAWSWQSRTGDFVTEEELNRLARNGRPLIHKHFSSEMTNAFIKDPITIFESLPDDTKAILARLAADKFDGLNTN